MKQEQKPSGGYRYNRISFFLNGRFRSLEIAPGISTLDLITKQLHLYGTKCSCNEGDCGACTVVIAQPREGSIVYEAITSCLYPAAKLHGKHLITVEGLGSPQLLHPIQKALLEHHGTQCGYCTPGFVMSLFACLASISHPDHESILAALEGNLCRCTGYQS
ncbi:MAG: 2Fe-2S iron-sulfur cluster-binding protein, partial [Candidatus Cloacimonetes bacterium]|nr:2Fe-2S iron-sulfur cluster-binding protein [Candidatus Cloacimonadota bacterium]